MATSLAVQSQCVVDRRLFFHVVGGLKQIGAGASGGGHLEDTISSPGLHMPNRLSPSQIENLECPVVSTTCSASALADVRP